VLEEAHCQNTDNNIRGNMLHFVRNFMDNRTFRVVRGAESSEKTHTDYGVVQGAVMSVTLLLVALADIAKQVQDPVEIVGYADDWTIHTSDQDMGTAQTNIQSALNNLLKWTRRKGFRISLEKNHDHLDSQIRLNGQILEKKNAHKF
jgi:hypothetical protein